MRPMRVKDIPEVLEIEKRSFISPWTPGMFAQTLTSPVSRSLVFIEGQEITGYLVFYHAGGEMHIMNVAVRPACRRQGIGHEIMVRALEFARTNSIEECFLEVRESNFPARSLYEKLGFKAIGKRKGYYSETNEDAIVMSILL